MRRHDGLSHEHGDAKIGVGAQLLALLESVLYATVCYVVSYWSSYRRLFAIYIASSHPLIADGISLTSQIPPRLEENRVRRTLVVYGYLKSK